MKEDSPGTRRRNASLHPDVPVSPRVGSTAGPSRTLVASPVLAPLAEPHRATSPAESSAALSPLVAVGEKRKRLSEAERLRAANGGVDIEPQRHSKARAIEAKQREQAEQRRRENAEALKALGSSPGHFGTDVTSFVRAAHDEGRRAVGQLDDSVRKDFKQQIKGGALTGASWGDVTIKVVSAAIGRADLADDGIYQGDLRTASWKEGVGETLAARYEGYQVTATRVRAHGDTADEKQIGEPLSPKPEYGETQFARAHRAPFRLGGAATNAYGTVFAPHYANLTADGYLEKLAEEKLAKHGAGNVFHFALDTDTQSTVGIAYRRAARKDAGKPEFKSVVLNYRRRDLDKDD
ncbi:hypothetical protein N8I74_09685 [Chitiniphilus purpureus]|uniref:Uncharacterized protein n=1 Tax=Chitiniphilus purpureus TaxID=2981137 RepID=A0ABY6DSE8_9NEIS|nr:hypothetical protein [Chitiniphilus sp. CD1]UXY17257.1 hypothetical protein N8I74_09685 [Chitiniphilus sp. CD1]